MIYDYECSSCGHKHYNVSQSVKDKPLKKCPACKKQKLQRVILSAPFVKCTNITTVGQLAEKNTKKIGKYKLSEAAGIADEKAPKSIYGAATRTESRKISKMNTKQKAKYIMEGNGL
jgi:putative FmdB family regulatory protein